MLHVTCMQLIFQAIFRLHPSDSSLTSNYVESCWIFGAAEAAGGVGVGVGVGGVCCRRPGSKNAPRIFSLNYSAVEGAPHATTTAIFSPAAPFVIPDLRQRRYGLPSSNFKTESSLRAPVWIIPSMEENGTTAPHRTAPRRPNKQFNVSRARERSTAQLGQIFQREFFLKKTHCVKPNKLHVYLCS